MRELFSLIHLKRNYLILYIVMIGGFNAYLFTKYRVGDLDVQKISFTTNSDRNDVLIYVYPYNSTQLNISHPIKPEVSGDTFSFRLDRHPVRNFRIYTGREMKEAYYDNMRIHYKNRIETLHLDDQDGISLINLPGHTTAFSSELTGYFQFKKPAISKTEFCLAEIWLMMLCIPICILVFNVFAFYVLEYLKRDDVGVMFAAFFILSMFLPSPIANTILILASLISIRKFSWQLFKQNKTGLFLVIYFSWIAVCNVFVSSSFYMMIIETTLPLIILPFYFSCLPNRNYLRLFVVGAFFVCLYFVISSSIDLSIYKNIDSFSFDSFVKYIHPVYVSYLIVFCLFYLYYLNDISVGKELFYALFVISLIACGSKLMICLAALFFAIQLFRKRIVLAIAFLVIAIGFVLVFSPTRKRFQEIANKESLSVLRSDPIQHNDPRLTGLTLRLLIWQETLGLLESGKDIAVGRGVDKNSDDLLKQRLKERGIRDQLTKYDPHNQFLTTLYKMGVVGLAILLWLCLSAFKLAFCHDNRLFVWSCILFVVAMMAESVLQRALGIYFFSSILILQAKQLISKEQTG